MKDDTFVIGDVHSHRDRLIALLQKAGIVNARMERIMPGITVIQVGDLLHLGTPTAHDFHLAGDRYIIDIQLWGNHDMAMVDPRHHFNGYFPPDSRVKRSFIAKHPIFFYRAHGFLITHAGLHPKYAKKYVLRQNSPSVYSIPRARGGYAEAGGILWRDASEPLDKQPQIFGHTRHSHVTQYGNSWCIDIGGVEDGKLAGIWLPSQTVVEVDLTKIVHSGSV